MGASKFRVVVPDTDFYRNMVKCQAACPVLTDARGYVTAIGRGDLETGFAIAHDPNPLSTICGRICGAPCEAACRRGDVGPDYEPVAIRPLKRVVTERFGPEAPLPLSEKQSQGIRGSIGLPVPGVDFSPARWSRESLRELATRRGRRKGRIAVVGAGPSSLSVAHDLALLGHHVEIFEAGPKSGGMIRYGVPVYRVEWEAMDAEVQSILDLGVQIHYETHIGRDITLTRLRQEFDAVFLGIGLMQGRKLRIEGEDLDGVIPAVDLLLNYNLGYKVNLGRRVIVVGGGDVAMDAARTAMRAAQEQVRLAGELGTEPEQDPQEVAMRHDEESETVHTALDVARTALRMGVADVRLIALESWDEMPASRFEIEEAHEEGIQIFPRHGPSRVIGQNGRVTGLEVIDVASVFDEVGRFNPRFVPGTNQVWECDAIILAIGQAADLSTLQGTEDIKTTPRGLVAINPETGQTSAPQVFAGGDVAYGPRLIIHAVRDGHIAAIGIEAYLQDCNLETQVTTLWEEIHRHKMPENWIKYIRSKVPALQVDRRTGISQVELGYSEQDATFQGLRCLECSINTIFRGDLCILCNGCVDVCPWDCLKIVRVDALAGDGQVDQVVEKSLGAGPAAWQSERTPTVAAMIKDDAACTRCALCAERCPTGAITMEKFRFKETLRFP